MKVCTVCTAEKPESEYYFDRVRYRAECKVCTLDRRRRDYAANAEAKRAYQRSRRAKDRLLARDRYARNPEPMKTRALKWHQENPHSARNAHHRRRQARAAQRRPCMPGL